MRTIVVTGASSGIGKAIVAAHEKDDFFILNGRNKQRLEQAAKEAGLTQKQYALVVGDIGEEETAKKILQLAEKYGINIVICNAGIGYFNNIEESNTEEFDKQFNTNVRGVYLTLKHTIPLLRKQDKGQIIAISSLAGKTVFPGGSGYVGTKWAVQGLVGSVKQELRDTHIKCCLICPGSVDTPFFDHLPFGATPDRHLTAEAVAQTVYNIINQPESSDIDEILLRPAKKQ